MDLLFKCRTCLHLPRNGSLNIGRRKPVLSWDHLLISRNHVQLDLQEDGAVLSLSVHGRNAVVVERQFHYGGSWDVVTIVDPGASALLPLDGISGNHATRLFVLGAREDSVVELRTTDARACRSTSQVDAGPPAKRQRRDTSQYEATAATASTFAAAPRGPPPIGPAVVASGVHGGARSPESAAAPPAVSSGTATARSFMATNAASTSGHDSSLELRPAAAQSAAPYDIKSPVHLMRVRGLSPRHNVGSLGMDLRRLISGPLQMALVSNYMVDVGWLLSACPELSRARQFFIVHGESPDAEAEMRQQAAAAGAAHVQLHRPPLPIMYGTHHSKAFLLTYPTGLRLIIHTANCVAPDCHNKTQGVWVQDFPRKASGTAVSGAAAAGTLLPPPPPSTFELDLVTYFRALALPPALAGPVFKTISAHDFSHARGLLVTSVPGYHRGTAAVQSYGHMRLRRLLEQVSLPAGFTGSSNSGTATGGGGGGGTASVSGAVPEGLVIQCSSMGSFDQAWLVDELGASLAAHQRPKPQQLAAASPPRPSGPPSSGPLPLAVVWPTVEEVRNSLEGWNAGRSIPGPSRNVAKPFMGRYYSRWGGEVVGRQRAMPHIKTYTRYRGQQLAWFLVSSHNLSKAAWGELQKNGSQLMVRSYELGVLVTPALEAEYRASPQYGFCCHGSSPADLRVRQPSNLASAAARGHVTFWSLAGAPAAALRQQRVPDGHDAGGHGSINGDDGGGDISCVIPVPYSLPPTPYRAGEDRPWVVDVPQSGLDALGLPWGSPYSHYGHTQQD